MELTKCLLYKLVFSSFNKIEQFLKVLRKNFELFCYTDLSKKVCKPDVKEKDNLARLSFPCKTNLCTLID